MRSDNKPIQSCVIVIFGATGDLTKRKLIPAIYALAYENLLPEQFKILALGRREYTTAAFQKQMEEAVGKYSRQPLQENIWGKIKQQITYMQFDFTEEESGYAHLRGVLASSSAEGLTNHLFFLAVAPDLFAPISVALHHNHLLDEKDGWRRIMIEKPFGENLAKATSLNEILTKVLPEDRIYRIDHYLGKEMFQNILTLRFSNSLFEPLWNRHYIDHIQISITETMGVGARGGYYDRSGALKDMVQNHLLQLVSLIAMEPPVKMDANCIRDEKLRVLRALRPVRKDTALNEVVLGQYTANTISGEALPGYTEEERIAPDSQTPTFAAIKLWVDNYRWSGVPFYIRTGKRLNKKYGEIAIQFKKLPGFKLYPDFQSASPNILVFRIQPSEGFYFQLNAKKPGNNYEMIQANMDYCQATPYESNSPEAYERLILEAIRGNNALFTRWDELQASWQYIEGLEEVIHNVHVPLHPYPAGSCGPDAAMALMKSDNRWWWNVEHSVECKLPGQKEGSLL